jgi:GNAT superfamily N-acetyltransferase
MLNNVFYFMNRKNSVKLNLHRKQNDSRLLFKADFEKFDYDLKNMLGWIYYPKYCFATIIDNKIVSCASAGYHADKIDKSVVEVTTATHKDYRGKGYAVSNVVALCEHVINMEKDKELHYMTGAKNIAAQKTAISAGLIKTRGIYILFRKILSKFE